MSRSFFLGRGLCMGSTVSYLRDADRNRLRGMDNGWMDRSVFRVVLKKMA